MIDLMGLLSVRLPRFLVHCLAVTIVVAELALCCRGYVALAVATEKGTSTKEVETGLGGDREGNMVAFAVEGLKFLKDVIKGNAKL